MEFRGMTLAWNAGILGSSHSTIEKAMVVDSADKATGQQGSQPIIQAQDKTGSLGQTG